MINNQDIKPEKQAYYLGARILSVLQANSKKTLELLDVFEELNKMDKVSYHAFSMAMNWLFLLGAIKLKDKGIISCF